MKKLDSFMVLTTRVGTRVSYTYAEIDEEGNIISDNNKGNFIVVDSNFQSELDNIAKYITNKELS